MSGVRFPLPVPLLLLLFAATAALLPPKDPAALLPLLSAEGFNATCSHTPRPYPTFKQCDPRWGTDLMVNVTICQVGCLMSSVSMALAGHDIPIPGNESREAVAANPGTLNAWLRTHHGYDNDNDLFESRIPNIAPSRIVWEGAVRSPHDLTPEDVRAYLSNGTVVSSNDDRRSS